VACAHVSARKTLRAQSKTENFENTELTQARSNVESIVHAYHKTLRARTRARANQHRRLIAIGMKTSSCACLRSHTDEKFTPKLQTLRARTRARADHRTQKTLKLSPKRQRARTCARDF
jgi:RecB family exonuclease